jgi:hypothetical protein
MNITLIDRKNGKYISIRDPIEHGGRYEKYMFTDNHDYDGDLNYFVDYTEENEDGKETYIVHDSDGETPYFFLSVPFWKQRKHYIIKGIFTIL